MYTYLALGDSYTIGEQVEGDQNFPAQTVAKLRRQFALAVEQPQIIATTGWTTDELSAAIKEQQLKGTFDFVTLLIGVNNQYRGRDTDNYSKEFAQLLSKAILFAGGKTSRVFVLSIPDWGVTPFAEGKDRKEIADAIDSYNKLNRSITLAYRCHYLDITNSTREHGTDESYLTPDKLHYSEKEYAQWATLLAPEIVKQIKPEALKAD